ncbi:MAG: GrpB family protein, partial [Kosmotogaceae bacterium]
MRGKPVIVTEYDPSWPELFRREAELIYVALEGVGISIEHIGSTAVPGLQAKPVIDIMIGVSSLEQADSCVPFIERTGYLYSPEHEDVMPERRYFERSGSKIDYHLHIVVFGSKFW